MESRFRKLFTRKKKKDEFVPITPSAKPLFNRGPSAGLNGHPVSSQPSRTPDLGQSRKSYDARRDHTSTAVSQANTTSRNKTQPILTGISRPDGLISRPNTSGGPQNAPLRSTQAIPKMSMDETRSPGKSKSSRYVDIFQISSVKPSNTYNEDVAERNLDMVRVALESGAHYRYVRGSTFQEEVATRNAQPPSQGRQSLDMPRPSRDTTRTNATNRRSIIAADALSASSTADKRKSYFWREQRLKAQDYANQLPTPPTIPINNNRLSYIEPFGDPSYNFNRKTGLTSVHSNINSGREFNTDLSLNRVSTVGSAVSPITPKSLPGSGLTDYLLSPLEVKTPSERAAARRSMIFYQPEPEEPPPSPPPVRPEHFTRSPSSVSVNSTNRTINLPTRTIMDLTGSDTDISKPLANETATENTTIVPPIPEPSPLRTTSRAGSRPEGMTLRMPPPEKITSEWESKPDVPTRSAKRITTPIASPVGSPFIEDRQLEAPNLPEKANSLRSVVDKTDEALTSSRTLGAQAESTPIKRPMFSQATLLPVAGPQAETQSLPMIAPTSTGLQTESETRKEISSDLIEAQIQPDSNVAVDTENVQNPQPPIMGDRNIPIDQSEHERETVPQPASSIIITDPESQLDDDTYSLKDVQEMKTDVESKVDTMPVSAVVPIPRLISENSHTSSFYPSESEYADEEIKVQPEPGTAAFYANDVQPETESLSAAPIVPNNTKAEMQSKSQIISDEPTNSAAPAEVEDEAIKPVIESKSTPSNISKAVQRGDISPTYDSTSTGNEQHFSSPASPTFNNSTNEAEVISFSPITTLASVAPLMDSADENFSLSQHMNNAPGTKRGMNDTPVRSVASQSTPRTAIQISPESLNSTDFINPSRAFGVISRDFADSPGRATPSKGRAPETYESNTAAKVTQPAKSVDQSSPTSPATMHRAITLESAPKFVSTFNEEEFAKKRAQAREALIKLQQSLDEDFMIEPPRIRNFSRINGVRKTTSDAGTPTAPNANHGHSRNTLSNEVTEDGNDGSVEETGSIYGQVTRPMSNSSEATVKPTYSNKGKQRESLKPSPFNEYIRRPNTEERMNELALQVAALSVLPSSHHNQNYQSRQPQTHPTSIHHNPSQTSFHNNNHSGFNTRPAYHTPSQSQPQSFTGASFSPPTHTRRMSSEIYHPLVRRGSTRSQASSSSAFSIPFAMIPDRSSSMRDQLVKETEEDSVAY